MVMLPEYNLTSKKFGHLEVIGYNGFNKKKGAMWDCKCKCGEIIIRSGGRLRQANPDYSCGCIGNWNSYNPIETIRNFVATRMRHAAAKGGRKMEITKDEVKILMDSPCHYCGTIGGNAGKMPKWRRPGLSGMVYRYNGIDRVDNTKGYIQGNVVPCCRICNKWKCTLTSEEFLAHCERIVAHQKSLKPWISPP
jgi:hypothetical protein